MLVEALTMKRYDVSRGAYNRAMIVKALAIKGYDVSRGAYN
jgi:hypothetical protein